MKAFGVNVRVIGLLFNVLKKRSGRGRVQDRMLVETRRSGRHVLHQVVVATAIGIALTAVTASAQQETDTPTVTPTPFAAPTATETPDGPTGVCVPVDLGSTMTVTVIGSTNGAQNSIGGLSCGTEPDADGDLSPDVVYQWTAPADGFYAIVVGGFGGLDPLLSVRDGSCTGPELACDDDFPGAAPGAKVLVSLTANQTIFIVLDGKGPAGGDYVFDIWPSPLPCLDVFLPGELAYTEATSSSYPPTGSSCTQGVANVGVKRTADGETFAVGEALARWDTSILPQDMMVNEVRVSLVMTAATDTDAQEFSAEWVEWGGTCSPGDYDTPGIGYAFSRQIGSLVPGGQQEFSLVDFATYLNLAGMTSIRMRVSGGEPVGINEVSFCGDDHPTYPPPVLWVVVCNPQYLPTPTPTPPASPTATEPPTPTYSPTPGPGCCAFEGMNQYSGICVDNVLTQGQPELSSIEACELLSQNYLDGDRVVHFNANSNCDPTPGDHLGTCPPPPTPVPGCCAFAGTNQLGAVCVDNVLTQGQPVLSSIDVCGILSQVYMNGDPVLHFNANSNCDPTPGDYLGTCPPPDSTIPAPVTEPIASDLVPGEGITISGTAGSAEAGATVRVTNQRTGLHVDAVVNPDGSFSAPPIDALMDDLLSVLVIDPSGNQSGAVELVAGSFDPELVAPPIDRTVASTVIDTASFLYDGDDPIQVGLDPGTIEPKRVAVIRGEVLDPEGEPIRGVRISVLGHPEYGHTRTRTDGAFDLAVNGGATLTLVYEGAGTFPVQRNVEVPWQDYIFARDVVLTEPDPAVTAVTLSPTAPLQVVAGSVEGDGANARRGVVIFPAGVEAEMILPGGNQPLSTLNVRITEYTVGARGPDAMPGELPPTSAYTYAFELSADEAIAAGATAVALSQPVPFYVENFVGFPVGMAVPLGSYDFEETRWEAAPDGVVVKVVSITSGVANLDVTGDGIAEDDTALAALGITSSERQALGLRYIVGQSLWRVTLNFFSRWDANWPGGAPTDAIAPNGGLPTGTNDRERLHEPDVSADGAIDFQNQALHQTAEIVGTPFTLTYQSDRQLDRATLNTMTIPVSGPTVPASLLRIDVIIDVAGRRFEESFPPQPNQKTAFTWDGKDAYGRLLQGWRRVKVEVRFVYPRLYGQPALGPRVFGEMSGARIDGFTNTRAELVSGVRFDGMIGGWDAKEEGLGGWSLNVHRAYDPISGTLNGGDGTETASAQLEPVITTVIGGGTAWPPVNGETEGKKVSLHSPKGVAVGADGTVYVADQNTTRRRVVCLHPNGTVSTVAGGGSSTASGIPATQASLSGPFALALDGASRWLYLTEYDGHRVRRVNLTTGIIETVAGSGTPCGSNCGIPGPALQAKLDRPSGLALAPDGTLYIGNDTTEVLMLGADGNLTSIAGGGSGSPDNDDMPAKAASFSSANIDVALGDDGTLYVVGGRNLVSKVTVDGFIYTVAGGGLQDSGDGLPGREAGMSNTIGLALDSSGGLFIMQLVGDRVRRLSPDGIVTAVASMDNNGSGFTGDSGPAPAAKLNNPFRAAVAPDGSLYVSDSANSRVRKITSPLPGFAAIGDIVIPSRDAREVYVFSSRGKHLRTVDALTNVVLYEFGYDADGRLASVTDRYGNVTAIMRDAQTGAISIQGPFAQETTLTLDANGYLASLTNPANETTDFTYTANGLLTGVTDPLGNLTSFTYNATGRLTQAQDSVQVTASAAQELVRTELANGYRVTHATAEGVETGYQVELLSTGDERRTTFLPDGTTDTTQINIDGTRAATEPSGVAQTLRPGPDYRFGMQAPVDQSATFTTPIDGLTATLTGNRSVNETNPADPLHTETLSVNGRTTTRTYSAATRTVIDTSPAGRQTRTVLDAEGRPVQQQLGSLTPVDLAYDPTGRLTSVAQGARTNTLTYAADGNVASVTDAGGRTIGFTYDPAGRVTTQTLPDTRVIEIAYNAKGNMTSLAPPSRPAHQFAYSPNSQPLVYDPPDIPPLVDPRTTYAYNLSGQLTRITRPDGQALFLDYDLLSGDLITQVFPSGQRNYSYHVETGNLELVTFPGGTLTYGYDGSLLKSETWTGTVAGSVSRTYDTSFRTNSQSVNGANPVAFTYDADDLLTGAGGMTMTRNTQTGLLTSTAMGVVGDTYGYNSFGELTSYAATVSGAPIFSVTYTRDALGRISEKTETVEGVTDAFSYGYDQAGRLTDVTKNGSAIAHYAYDPNGNRVGGFNQVCGAISNVTVDDQDRLLAVDCGPSTQTYTYTANGERLTKADADGTTTYTYDVLGNLTRAVLPDSTEIDYLIDGRDRRIGKTQDSTLVQGLLYDGQLTPVAEKDGTGALIGRFVYGSKPNVPDYVIRAGVIYRIISDHLGSPRLVINTTTTGAVVQRTNYDEFGNVVFDDVDGAFRRLPFGFAGGLYDADTGLVRFGARDYDPQTGRWTAKDPIGFDGGAANLFGYVANDPINRVDGSGLAGEYADLSAGMGISQQLAARIALNLPKLLSVANRARVSLAIAGATVDKVSSGMVQLLRPGGLQSAVQAFQQIGGSAAQWGRGNPSYGPVMVFKDQFLTATLRFSSYGATPGVPMTGAPTLQIAIRGVAQDIVVRFLE